MARTYDHDIWPSVDVIRAGPLSGEAGYGPHTHAGGLSLTLVMTLMIRGCFNWTEGGCCNLDLRLLLTLGGYVSADLLQQSPQVVDVGGVGAIKIADELLLKLVEALEGGCLVCLESRLQGSDAGIDRHAKV